MTQQLCNAYQPDGKNQRCILYGGHEGAHQTFVAEWRDGQTESRRRQPRVVSHQLRGAPRKFRSQRAA